MAKILDSGWESDHLVAVISEYLQNTRALLRQKPELFRLMVERQIQGRLLPRIKGSRDELETQLWELLDFCTHGHESTAPDLNDEALVQATEVVQAGKRPDGAALEFPKAAAAVTEALLLLREAGALPPPRGFESASA